MIIFTKYRGRVILHIWVHMFIFSMFFGFISWNLAQREQMGAYERSQKDFSLTSTWSPKTRWRVLRRWWSSSWSNSASEHARDLIFVFHVLLFPKRTQNTCHGSATSARSSKSTSKVWGSGRAELLLEELHHLHRPSTSILTTLPMCSYFHPMCSEFV